MTKAQVTKIKQLTPLIQAIKSKCFDCSANSFHEIKMCPCKDCPLFNFREGLPNFTRGNIEGTAKNGSEGRAENE